MRDRSTQTGSQPAKQRQVGSHVQLNGTSMEKKSRLAGRWPETKKAGTEAGGQPSRGRQWLHLNFVKSEEFD